MVKFLLISVEMQMSILRLGATPVHGDTLFHIPLIGISSPTSLNKCPEKERGDTPDANISGISCSMYIPQVEL